MQLKVNKALKGLSLIIIVVIIYFIINNKIDFLKISDIEYLRSTIASFGIISPIIYILIMAIAIVISPIPSLPLAAASGIIWGPFLGTIYSVIGAEIGAIISFLIARNLGRGIIEKIFHKDITFCDKYVEKNITLIVFIARLFPFFQFDIISYGAGLAKISLRNFALATFFGMIPMTFLFTYFGKSLFIGNALTIIFSLVLIISIFSVPILIKKYNFFGLKNRIRIENIQRKR